MPRAVYARRSRRSLVHSSDTRGGESRLASTCSDRRRPASIVLRRTPRDRHIARNPTEHANSTRIDHGGCSRCGGVSLGQGAGRPDRPCRGCSGRAHGCAHHDRCEWRRGADADRQCRVSGHGRRDFSRVRRGGACGLGAGALQDRLARVAGGGRSGAVDARARRRARGCRGARRRPLCDAREGGLRHEGAGGPGCTPPRWERRR